MSEKMSILARLLANENIEIRHGSYETAFFDVKKRLLGLPMWNDDNVYDLLIGHEVGHALFTPPEGWEEDIQGSKCPKTIFNVVEDIRIERMIQVKYPGLVASFNRGYQYLQNKDFFGIDNKNHIKINDYNFIDRLNLKAKLRNLLEVDFTPEEQFYIDKAYAAESWNDVVETSELIYDFMKSVLDNTSNDEFNDSTQQNDDSTQQNDEFNDSTQQNDDMVNDSTQQNNDSTQDLSNEAQSLESETDKLFNSNKSKELLNRNKYGYLEIVSQGYSQKQKKEMLWDYNRVNEQRTMYEAKPEDTVKFVNDNKDIVANMVKEFELRKSAYMYARATVSKTGSLDMKKLHQYKFSDDIFLSTTKLAESKNHGMVMLVDYSGSMQSVLRNVIKQTLILAMFCKKAAIPFVVYGFTGSNADCYIEDQYSKPEMDFSDHSTIRVFELISSSMNKAVYNQAFGALVQQSMTEEGHYYGQYYRNIGIEALGHTPLNEALIVLYDVMRDFRKKHDIQKLSLVALTDGDSNVIRTKDGSRMSKIKVDGSYMKYDKNITDKIIKDMKTKKVFDNCINYNLMEEKHQKKLVYNCVVMSKHKKPLDYVMKILRKENSYSFDSVCGYDRVIIITQNNSTLDLEVGELEIKDATNKSEVIKAFKKYSSSKKISRVLATKFAESIA